MVRRAGTMGPISANENRFLWLRIPVLQNKPRQNAGTKQAKKKGRISRQRYVLHFVACLLSFFTDCDVSWHEIRHDVEVKTGWCDDLGRNTLMLTKQWMWNECCKPQQSHAWSLHRGNMLQNRRRVKLLPLTVTSSYLQPCSICSHF